MKTFSWAIFLFASLSLSSCATYIDKRRENIEIPILVGYLKPLKSYNEFYFKSNWSGTRDKERDTPIPYKINLPQNIKLYNVGLLSESYFVYDSNQFIFIIQLYETSHTYPTQHLFNEDDWENIIAKSFDYNTLKQLKLEDYHLNKGRKSIMLFKDGVSIILYNIKDKNYDQYLRLIETFKKQ